MFNTIYWIQQDHCIFYQYKVKPEKTKDPHPTVKYFLNISSLKYLLIMITFFMIIKYNNLNRIYKTYIG